MQLWNYLDVEGLGRPGGESWSSSSSGGLTWNIESLSLLSCKMILVLSHQLELLNLTAGLPPQVVEEQVQRSLVSDQVHLFYVLLQA